MIGLAETLWVSLCVRSLPVIGCADFRQLPENAFAVKEKSEISRWAKVFGTNEDMNRILFASLGPNPCLSVSKVSWTNNLRNFCTWLISTFCHWRRAVIQGIAPSIEVGLQIHLLLAKFEGLVIDTLQRSHIGRNDRKCLALQEKVKGFGGGP